jgi:hypothetical protein
MIHVANYPLIANAARIQAGKARRRRDYDTMVQFQRIADAYSAIHERLTNPEPYRPTWCPTHGIEGTTVDCLRGVCSGED